MKKSFLYSLIFLFILFFCGDYFIDSFLNYGLNSEELLAQNLLGLNNFNNKDYEESSIVFDNKVKQDKINNTFGFDVYSPLYFSVKNLHKQEIEPMIILNHQDWSSNRTIMTMALSDNQVFSSEEKILKLMQYINENIYHEKPPFYAYTELSNPVVFFNLFGYGFCSDFSYSLAILAEFADFRSRMVYLDGHVVAEVFYDEKWHMFDTDLGIYFRKDNGEIASVEDIFNNLFLLNQHLNHKEFLLKVFSKRYVDSYEYKDYFLKVGALRELKYQLQPGEEIRFYYDWRGDWFWSDFPHEPPTYTNGLLISVITNSFLPKKRIRKFELPYAILKSYIYGKNICKKSDKLLFSLNGRDWIKVENYCQDDVVKLTDVFPKGKNAKMAHHYYLKTTGLLFPRFLVYTQFQVAPKSIPRLEEGENKIELKNVEAGKVKLNFVFSK